MLARKGHEGPGSKLPKNFEEKIQSLLIENYQSRYDSKVFSFEVHGLSYPSEVVLTASLINTQNKLEAPVTYHVSSDLDDSIKMDKLLNDLVDSIGLFFDSYFSTPEWNDYSSRWEEMKFKSLDLFYKVTRENISASLAADQLLD